MKKEKKSAARLPEVQILGDLEDVGMLLKSISKKRSLVVFRDAEQNINHAEVDGTIQVITDDEIAILQKDFRFIYFDFYPSKKVLLSTEESADSTDSFTTKGNVKKAKKEKKSKKEHRKKKK